MPDGRFKELINIFVSHKFSFVDKLLSIWWVILLWKKILRRSSNKTSTSAIFASDSIIGTRGNQLSYVVCTIPSARNAWMLWEINPYVLFAEKPLGSIRWLSITTSLNCCLRISINRMWGHRFKVATDPIKVILSLNLHLLQHLTSHWILFSSNIREII